MGFERLRLDRGLTAISAATSTTTKENTSHRCSQINPGISASHSMQAVRCKPCAWALGLRGKADELLVI